MERKMRRFTITMPPDVERELETARQEQYSQESSSAMLRELIIRGLQSLQEDVSGVQHVQENIRSEIRR